MKTKKSLAKKLSLAALALVMLLGMLSVTAMASDGSLLAFYDYNGNLNNSAPSTGTSVTLTENKFVSGADASYSTNSVQTDTSYLAFTAPAGGKGGYGHEIRIGKSLEQYTIALRFAYNDLDAGFRSIINFEDGTADAGFYFHQNKLEAFSMGGATGSGSTTFSAGQIIDLLITRDENNLFTVYSKSGDTLTTEFQSTDTAGDAIPFLDGNTSVFHFFSDNDTGHANAEYTSNAHIYSIKIWDYALTEEEVDTAGDPISVTYKDESGATIGEVEEYNPGATVTVRADRGTPGFSGWESGSGTIYQPGDTFEIQNATVLTEYIIPIYDLTKEDAKGHAEGCSYDLQVNGSTVAEAEVGDTVTIVPALATGHRVHQITVTKTGDTTTTTVTKNSDGSYTFTMPRYPVDVEVTFGKGYDAPTGYITDINGLMAYKDMGGNRFDMQGIFDGVWKQITYSKNGFATKVEGGVGVEVRFEHTNDGQVIAIHYDVTNNSGSDQDFSFGSHADIQIGSHDAAPITSLFDDTGFMMVSQAAADQKDGDSAQFNMFLKDPGNAGSTGITDVTGYWYGHYGRRTANVFTDLSPKNDLTHVDSGAAWHWRDTLANGGSKTYTVKLGIGGNGSEDVLVGAQVTFHMNNGEGVVKSAANGAVTVPPDPAWEGYTFVGWHTDAELTTPATDIAGLSVFTQLYAKWEKDSTSDETDNDLPVQNQPIHITDATRTVDNLATKGWAWNSETNTLTLSGLNMYLPYDDSAIDIDVSAPVTIVLAETSNNTILGSACAIDAENELIFKGEGTLNATTKLNGIRAEALTMQGGHVHLVVDTDYDANDFVAEDGRLPVEYNPVILKTDEFVVNGGIITAVTPEATEDAAVVYKDNDTYKPAELKTQTALIIKAGDNTNSATDVVYDGDPYIPDAHYLYAQGKGVYPEVGGVIEAVYSSALGSLNVKLQDLDGNVAYQWYRNVNDSNTAGGVPIEGATEAIYNLPDLPPDELQIGPHYYYVTAQLDGVTYISEITTVIITPRLIDVFTEESLEKWYGTGEAVTLIAKEGWEVFDAAGETPSESFTYTPDYNETDGVVTTSQTLSVQTEGGITVDGSPLIYDFDYKARYDKRITEFVEQVDNLGSNPSLDELSDVMKYYDDLPEYIKDRLKENVGATVALEELTTLLDDKEDDIKTAVEVAIDEADSIADIERAKILYDALDDAAKEEIPNKDLLDKKQEDAEKAQNIIDILNELNPGGSYEEKKSALELYDDLTDDQKALIDDKHDHVEVAGAVAAVDGVIDLLENIEKPYSAQDLDEIQAAQDAFDALTDDQKAGFPADIQDNLAEMKDMADKVQDVGDAIGDLDSASTEVEIKAAKDAYEALTDEEKAMIPQADKDKLDSEYNEIVNSMTEDEKAVEDFERLVNEVKEKPTADAIEKLEDAFNKLTPDQKNAVNSGVEDTYDDLVAARTVIEALEAAEVGEDLEGVLSDYNGLTNAQKDLVNAATDNAGVDLEAQDDKVTALETAVGGLAEPFNPSQQEDIENAKLAYEALDEEGRKLLDPDIAEKLDALYENVLDALEYKNKDSTPNTEVEVTGLAENVALPEDSKDMPKTTIALEVADSTPANPPVVPGKIQIISIDAKLIANMYENIDDTEPVASEQVQPKVGESVTLKLALPPGYIYETLEIYHVKDNGLRIRIYDFTLITENDTLYAIFAVDSFSHFVVLGERSASPGGGSTSSSYTPERNDPDNGDYTVTPSAPKKGDAVTIKPESDEGYIVDKVVVKDNNGEDIEVTVNVDGTYTFVQPSGKVTITVTFKEVAVGVKLDKENHFAYMSGMDDGTFAPDRSITRAEVVVMFSRLMEEKMDADMTYTSTFTDITGDEWYANAIGYMEQFDIVSGYEDGTFRPNQPITRAEFATIASRFETFVESDTNDFSDVADDYWALPYINSVAAQGFVNGYPDGTFKPTQSITRAEAVTVVNNMLERTADEAFIANNMAELTTFDDVDSEHWAYYQILEASNGHEHTMSEGKETWTELH